MVNDNPFFSVIVPIYNVQKYINECLDSILCQSYKNLEIILVDDGSPDSCPAICDDYASKDSRIKVIHQSNKGLSEARNCGIRAATGDYLLFIDSDDKLCDNQAFERLVEFIETAGAGSPVIYCSGSVKFNNDQTSFNFKPALEDNLCLNPDEFICFVRKNNLYMAAWTFAIRRDFFTEHSLFFYPGIYFEDMEWFPRLLFAKPGLKVNVFQKPYYLYRNNPASITNNFAKPHFESYVKILDFYKKQMQVLPPNLFINDLFNSGLYCMFIFFEHSCLAGDTFFKSSRPAIASLFRQNYHLLNPRNKILYIFILVCPKAFFVLRKLIKKVREK